MKKLAKKLLLLFISIQFVACEGSLEPHLYGVVDTGNAFNTPARPFGCNGCPLL